MGLAGKRNACVAITISAALLGSVLALLCSVAAPAASAAAPEFLLRIPEAGVPGSGAGELGNPRAVATDPGNGHIFVSDSANSRINEFTAWGEFVKAWGWGVAGGASLQVCGPAEPESSPPPSLCQAGSSGSAAGQIATPNGIAVDSDHNVYVFERINHRVSKFSSAGAFLLMFGGDVNKTKVEEGKPEAERNVCTAVSGDVCGIGTVGTGDGQFKTETAGTFLTIGPTDTIFVGDEGRVQTFNTSGIFLADLPDPDDVLDGESVFSMAANDDGHLYLDLSQNFTSNVPQKPLLYKLDASSGQVLDEIEVGFPKALATDIEGNVYVAAKELVPTREEVLVFDPEGNPVVVLGDGFSFAGEFELIGLGVSPACPDGATTGPVYAIHFSDPSFAYLDAYGTPPICFEAPPEVAPEISAQFATEVNSDGAVVKAQINPRFWSDTRYHVEYGTGKCSEGGCPNQLPLGPGSLLTDKVTSKVLTSKGVFLAGLSPETTYRYRFVAQSGGGGPVYGVDPEGLGEASPEEGLEGTFTTPGPRPPAKTDCPNQAFRSAAGAYLPDCRAYEMVSPVDKGNGDILVLSARDGFPRGMEQASPGGGGLAYATYRAFGDSESAPYSSEYLATRDPGSGWSTRGVNPPREGTSFLTGTQFLLPFKAFSQDLSQAWLQQDTEPVLVPGTPTGFTNLYRRQDSVPPSYEALITSAPANLGDWVFKPEVQGASADGSCTAYRANDKLATAEPTAPDPGNVYQVYLSCNGTTRLVSVLPNGTPNTTNATVGTANPAADPDRNNSLSGAVSADGQSVYWTAHATAFGPGSLHLRTNAAAAQSKLSAGKCTEAAKACSVLVATGAQFHQAATDGSRALYSAGGKLFLYDAESASSTEVAGQLKGVVGASEDLGRIYFVSEASFDGGVAGKPNLYLDEGGAKTFVGELSAKDAQPNTSGLPSMVAINASRHLARTSPDGLHLAFMSTAPLTGYDNTDAVSGEADAELFLYAAAGEELRCVSCNPTGQRPAGQPLMLVGTKSDLSAAARIPAWKTALYAPRVLAADGSRLFFESFEALVPADTNGKLDVYQWSRAQGKDQCEEIGAALYAPAAGGCLSLISSGESSEDSEFVDATPEGSDVFIRTGESLLPQDPGLIDIYDARVQGGFPPPPSPQPECEGTACQNPPPPPSDPTPSSQAFVGPGNLKDAPPRKCPKGKHKVKKKGKVRCVPDKKKAKAKKKSKAAKRGRAGR